VFSSRTQTQGCNQPTAKEVLVDQQHTGAPGTIRTCGLHLRRVALYPAELRVHHRGYYRGILASVNQRVREHYLHSRLSVQPRLFVNRSRMFVPTIGYATSLSASISSVAASQPRARQTERSSSQRASQTRAASIHQVALRCRTPRHARHCFRGASASNFQPTRTKPVLAKCPDI
jgi:hypothetical protein